RLRLTRQPRVIPSFLFPFKEPLALLRGAKVGKLFRIRNNYFQGISSLFFPSSSGCPSQKGFSFEAGCKGKKHFLFHCKLFQESFLKFSEVILFPFPHPSYPQNRVAKVRTLFESATPGVKKFQGFFGSDLPSQQLQGPF
ncbi:hypothetical protein, partial [Pontibacter aydingkolensis]